MIEVRNIAVADDVLANREAAAKAIAKFLPSANIHLFSSAEEIINALRMGSPQIDLVLTDMQMEDESAGYRVAVESWSWNIPSTVITGGSNHGKSQVVLCYPQTRFDGEKDDQIIWENVLRVVLNLHRNALVVALKYGRYDIPDADHGKACAAVVSLR